MLVLCKCLVAHSVLDTSTINSLRHRRQMCKPIAPNFQNVPFMCSNLGQFRYSLEVTTQWCINEWGGYAVQKTKIAPQTKYFENCGQYAYEFVLDVYLALWILCYKHIAHMCALHWFYCHRIANQFARHTNKLEYIWIFVIVTCLVTTVVRTPRGIYSCFFYFFIEFCSICPICFIHAFHHKFIHIQRKHSVQFLNME